MAWISKFVAFALLCHLLFFVSIFEIHFKSPIIRNLAPVPIHQDGLGASAKRVVIFVIDGLRYDKWIEFIDSRPESFMASKVHGSRSAWGISHTRVPTETRPGHVALLAGFYEDPSAVFRGWQDNPVDFDSVFNRSSKCFAWGAPDVVLMFRKGGAETHCEFFAYDAEVMDFSEQNASVADAWVFSQAEKRLTRPGADIPTEQGVVFMYHLLGMDLVGHNKKPQSREYMECLFYVDSGIRSAVDMFEKLYADGQTVYVMSADHGMTDWGSHGAGDDEETQTPILVWREKLPISCGHACERLRVNQADITPLISALVGIAVPVNSVGALPFDVIRAFSSQKYAVHALLANANQILAQVYALMTSHRGTISFRAFPFNKLQEENVASRISRVEELLHHGELDEAEEIATELRETGLAALAHYQALNKPIFMVSVLGSFCAWFGILMEEIIRTSLRCERKRKLTALTASCMILSILTVVVLAVEHSSVASYAYLPLPWLLFAEFFSDANLSRRVLCAVPKAWKFIVILSIVILSWACSFFWRPALILSSVLLAVWPWRESALNFSAKKQNNKSLHLTKICYTLSSIALGAFALTPVVGKKSEYLYVYGGSLFSAGLVALDLCRVSSARSAIQSVSRMLLVLGSGINVFYTARSVADGHGLPSACQVFSWASLILVVMSCVIGSGTEKRLNLLASLSAVFTMLSIRHEALFLPVLVCNSQAWIALEKELRDDDSLGTTKLDFFDRSSRRAIFLVAYALLAFFGIGNVASLNSFDPTSVYCFVTVFSPFTMTALMIFKIMIPIFVVTLAYSAISSSRNEFLTVLMLGDALSSVFFCLVRSSGSWLDIGTSISHYVISMCLSVILMLLHEACSLVIIDEKEKIHAA